MNEYTHTNRGNINVNDASHEQLCIPTNAKEQIIDEIYQEQVPYLPAADVTKRHSRKTSPLFKQHNGKKISKLLI